MYLGMRPITLFVIFCYRSDSGGKLKKWNMSTTKSMRVICYSAFKFRNQSYMDTHGKPENQKENEGTCACVWQNFMSLPLSIVFYIADMYALPSIAIHTHYTSTAYTYRMYIVKRSCGEKMWNNLQDFSYSQKFVCKCVFCLPSL